jgi:hypothetical protein
MRRSSGVNTTVAQIQDQLDNAKWELEQTTIRAPGDGYVTVMALSVGDRATQARAVMSFIITDEITIIGMFSPNGFQTIKPGATVKLVFDDDPRRIHDATITEIPQGVGQGQIAVSGTLARVGSIGGVQALKLAASKWWQAVDGPRLAGFALRLNPGGSGLEDNVCRVSQLQHLKEITVPSALMKSRS